METAAAAGAGLVLSLAPVAIGVGLGAAGGWAAGLITSHFACNGGGKRMEDPDNPGLSAEERQLGVLVHANTAIAGAALNGIIARRGGCYVAPRSPADRLIGFIGRKSFQDRINLREANPATDIQWGTEHAARPPSNVDWNAVLRESRRKYEWVAGTIARLNKERH